MRFRSNKNDLTVSHSTTKLSNPGSIVRSQSKCLMIVIRFLDSTYAAISKQDKDKLINIVMKIDRDSSEEEILLMKITYQGDDNALHSIKKTIPTKLVNWKDGIHISASQLDLNKKHSNVKLRICNSAA